MAQLIEVPGFGRVEFPDGMSDQAITSAIQKNMVPPKQSDGWLTKIRKGAESYLEPAATLATGLPAMVAGNVAGMAGDYYSRAVGGPMIGEDVRRDLTEAMTYAPRSQGGQEKLQDLGKWMQGDVGKAIMGLPIAGQELSTIARTAVPATRQAANIAAQEAALAGRAIKPYVEPAANMAGKLVRNVSALGSGKNSEVFSQAYKSGKAAAQTGDDANFAANMRAQAPVEQILTDAKASLFSMQDDMSKAYVNAKTGWAADKTPLKFDNIDEAFNRLVGTTYQDGKSLIGKAERTKLDEVATVLDEWRGDPSSHTTVGLDALKRRIDAIYPDSPMQTQAQRVITGVRNSVKDTIVNQAPEYATAMKAYEEAASTIRDITGTLGLGGKTSKDTAINKLLSLSKNNEFRKAMGGELAAGGKDIMPAIAGQALQESMPTGFGRLSAAGVGGAAYLAANPWLAPLIGLTSPRLLGEAFYGAGKLAGKIQGKKPLPEATPPANTLPVPFTSQGQYQQAGAGSPNWVPGRGILDPDVQPAMVQEPGLLGFTPNAEMQRPRGFPNANMWAERAAQEAEAAAPRKPASGGVLYDFDPITGQLRPVDQGIKGATPSTVESTGNNLSSAVDKISSGRRFAMSSEERIAWDKSKVDLGKAAPELRGLSDDAIAARVADRQWVANRIQELKTEYADWAKGVGERFNAERAGKINERANNPPVLSAAERATRKQMNSAAARQMELNMETRRADMQAKIDALESLQDQLSAPRAGNEPYLGPGSKTRAFKKGLLDQ